MKRIAIWVIAIMLSSLPMSKIMAHTLETAHSIGAVMHIEPEDNPHAGEQSRIFFGFKDQEGKFSPAHCTCIVSLTQDGQEIFSQSLVTNNPEPTLNNLNFSFIFPTATTYQMQVKGEPLPPAAFEPFTLTYDIQVNTARLTPVSVLLVKQFIPAWFYDHAIHFLGAGIFGIVTLVLIVQERITNSRAGKKSELV